jgi:hypothetical protein
VYGHTLSQTDIATSGAFQGSHASPGTLDACLYIFSNQGGRLWSTYYGGEGNEDYGWAASGNLTRLAITGSTNSSQNIASPTAHQTIPGGQQEGYIALFDIGSITTESYFPSRSRLQLYWQDADHLRVEVSSVAKLQWVDLLGRIHKEETLAPGQHILSLQALPSGVYFCR